LTFHDKGTDFSLAVLPFMKKDRGWQQQGEGKVEKALKSIQCSATDRAAQRQHEKTYWSSFSCSPCQPMESQINSQRNAAQGKIMTDIVDFTTAAESTS
jgi:hypothetical protein